MTGDQSADVDLLDVLHANLDRIAAGLADVDERTPYIDGQLAYLESLDAALDDVGPDVIPRDLLADVAGEHGLELTTDGSLDPAPLEAYEAGVLSMWSLALGIVEGARAGVQATMDAVDDFEGVTGSMREER